MGPEDPTSPKGLAEPKNKPAETPQSHRFFTTPLYPPISTFTLLLTILWTLFDSPKGLGVKKSRG